MSNLVVHGMLQLRQFAFLCGVLVSTNMFNPVLFGYNDAHWILRVELDCFSAFFLFGFIPLGLVQAWIASYSDG